MLTSLEVFLFIELIVIGIVTTMPDTFDSIIFHISLGLRIVSAFLWWGLMGGTQSITITIISKGETKHITIGTDTF